LGAVALARSLMESHGDTARREIARRGLIYFDDVLDEIRELRDPISRAALAVTAAHDLVERGAGPLERTCVAAIEAMWRTLGSATDGVVPANSDWLEPLAEAERSDVADRDSVAATLYAKEAVASGSSAAAAFAVGRLIDDCFARVDAGGTAEDFAEACGSPLVQTALRRIRSELSLLRIHGPTPAQLERLKSLRFPRLGEP